MSKSRRIRRAGHVGRVEEGRSAFKISTDKPTGKRPLGRPKHNWEDNVRMYLKEIAVNTRNSIDSAQDKDFWRVLVNTRKSMS